jgi:K+-transporting ATPase KdpF subunit
MSIENVVGTLLSIGVLAYLIYTLLRPEKF